VLRGATDGTRLGFQGNLCSTACTKSGHATSSPNCYSPLDERRKFKDSRQSSGYLCSMLAPASIPNNDPRQFRIPPVSLCRRVSTIRRTASLNCMNSMQDSKRRVYRFKLKGLPPSFPVNPFPTPHERKTVNSNLIDCTGNTGQVLNWSRIYIHANKIDQNDPRARVNYYVVMGAPPPLE